MRIDPGRKRIRNASMSRARRRARVRGYARALAERDIFFAHWFDGDRVGCIHDDRDRDCGWHAPAPEPRWRDWTRSFNRSLALGGSDWLRNGCGLGRIADFRRRLRGVDDRSSAAPGPRLVG